MNTITIATKGQIVIPARIWRKLNMKRGAKLHVEERGGEIILRPVTSEYFDSIAGILPAKGKLTRALIKERGEDKERGGYKT